MSEISAQLTTALADRYRLERELGAGGMATVYLAEDLKHQRQVAVKVLRAELANALGPERFHREITTTANLRHPHILPLYDSGEAAGFLYYVMPYVEGESLRERLTRERQLPLEDALQLAREVAEALAYAHEHGVIHRDIKPENVLLERGHAVVADFGIARALTAAGEKLTQTGLALGTPLYMSPEQASGEKVDARSDLYSLACLLYEMLAGSPPFAGSTALVLMARHALDPVPSLRTARPTVTASVSSAIERALAKTPADRFPTVRAWLDALAGPPGPVAAAGHTRLTDSGAQRAAEGFWVAVLPFKYGGANPALEALAEGLTEEIVTGLSRFSYLKVIAGASTARSASETPDVRVTGEELGARYVLEGNLRQAGAMVRVSVHLIDAKTGAHLWSERYDRGVGDAEIFSVQDEITDRVVATTADPYGVLARSLAAPTGEKALEQLTPYEALLRFFLYQQRVTAEDHRPTRVALRRAVETAPNYADAWAALAIVLLDEDRHLFNPEAGALDRALEAALRAVNADPANQLANYALAQTHYYRGDLGAFRSAAAGAIGLNQRDSNTMAMLGLLHCYSGDWDLGIQLTTRAMDLNPHHPGWYRFGIFFNEYRQRRYAEALAIAQTINMPDYFATHYTTAIAHAQLGNAASARAAAQKTRELWPEFEQDFVTGHLTKWLRNQPGLTAHILEGVELAGFRVRHPDRDRPEGSHATGREPAGVAIAVLPFSDMSPARDQEYLCEGMAEEIMNALVAVPGIRVASRTSAFRAGHDGKDLGEIAKVLSVGHVLEGGVRMAGQRLRVTTQLTDVATGYQVWSERYDREVTDVFALQDDIAAGVVEVVKARLAPGERTVRVRPQVGNLEAYRHYLKGRHLRYTKNDFGPALKAFEEAVRLDPSHAPSWVGLAEVNVLASASGLLPAGKAFTTAKDALATAAARQGESAEALYVEGMIAFGERNWTASDRALRRAVALQPTYIQARCWYGFMLTALGRASEAAPHLELAREADPLGPYPYAMNGLALLIDGRATEADALYQQALAFEAENSLALWGSGTSRIALGHFEEGIAMLQKAATPSQRGGFIHGALGWALAAAGRIGDARVVLDELRARPAPAPAIISEAWLLAALGELDSAIGVLERAEVECQVLLPLTGLPGLDPLRSDPRFQALLARMGLPASTA